MLNWLNILWSSIRAGKKAGSSYKHYVFIVTYGRSGSTLLQSIIGSIPGYYMTGENFDALYGLFQSYKNAKDTKERHGRERQAGNHPWHGADRVDPHDYARRLADVFVQEIIKPPLGSRAVGFKEIRYLRKTDDLEAFLDFMREFFPPARIVFNTRAVEKVIQSGWWKDHPQDELASLVRRFDARARAYAAQHPEQALVVNHDEYVQDPLALRPLFDFLGEPFDARRIERILAIKLPH